MLRRLFQCSLFFCFLLFSFRSQGQDSLHTTRYDSHYYLFDKTTKSRTQLKDSSFNQLPNYFPRNWMGHIGLPDYPYLLIFRNNDPLGVRWFSSPYDARLLGLSTDGYFWQKGLYTSVFGAAGSKKEQVLKLFHTQNLNERLNLSLLLNRYAGDGFYQFQKSFVNSVLFSSTYEGKKKRFGFFSSFSFDRFKHQENGGLTSDTSIVLEPFVNKSLLPVQLRSARRNYSLMAGNLSFFFKLNRDSLARVNHYVLTGAKTSINKSQYNDVPSDFYTAIYKDSTVTNDTSQFIKFSPSLSYNLNAKRLNFELGGRYDQSTWKERDSSATDYTSLIAFQGFAWQDTSHSFTIREHASYVASGENNGDYEADLSALYQLPCFGTSTFELKAAYENRSPDLFFRHYSSNNFFWNNTFDKTQTTKVEARMAISGIRLELGTVYSNTNNIILLGGNSLPVQFEGGLKALRFYVRHHLKVYKFHLVNDISYQSENSFALALPQLYTFHQLYFEHRVKKNGLKLQVGVQANYVSEMDILSYNPALNSFFLQYGNERKGNYVFGDFFFSVYFKPVKFFFKAEHLNQGFTGIDYTFVNSYYQPDRAFRFGLNWEFWD